MYNIIQLNDKNLSELQTIAQELGIKKTDSLKKEELVYKILDEQAIAGATKKVAADKLKEERKGEKQKRSRVTVKTVKRKVPTKCSQPIKTETSPKPKQRKHRLRKNNPKLWKHPKTDHRSCNAGASQRSRRTQTQTGTPPQGKGRDCCTPSNGNPEGCRTGIELRG